MHIYDIDTSLKSIHFLFSFSLKPEIAKEGLSETQTKCCLLQKDKYVITTYRKF